jgi:BirA family biotin operon repressor/biotin-[acetyl-CoA-carboxylase] ligase
MPTDSNPLVTLECVDSTNNYAMAQVHSGNAHDGNAWFAMEQTAGKGRQGKTWKTEKGQNVTESIVIDAHFLKVFEQFQLSVAVALGCVDFFRTNHNVFIKIKWPNDLFWNDRKAGGILIENVVRNNIWQWAVIGIGLNINQTEFAADLNKPVSLKQITGETYDVIKAGTQLYRAVTERINSLKTNGFKSMWVEYNHLLYKKDEMVKLKKANAIFETTITSVSQFGKLKTFDTLEREFDFDEVEWLL